MSKALYYATMVAMLFYCIAVETIDGKGNGPLHTPSAVIFFLTFEISIVETTFYLYRLRQWNASVISGGSLQLKMLLAVYITVTWFYCLYKNLAGESFLGKTDFTVVLEWNAYIIDLFWILSYLPEWKQLQLCLIES